MYRMQRTQRMSLVPLPQHRHWDSIKIIWLSVTLLSVIAVIYDTRYFLLGVDASEHSNDLLLQMPAISSNDDADDDHDSPKQQYLQDVHVDSFPRQLELNDPYKYNANSRAIADKRISPYPPQQVRLNSNDMYYQVQRIEPFVLQKYEQPGLTAKNARMVEEESNEEQGQCVPMGDWQSAIFPTCNTAHEISMQAGKNVEFINCGGDRCAFKLTDNSNEIVLKIPKWKRNFEPSGYSKARLDGVSMERLSQSDYVLDIYAYCGLSQVIELGDGGGNLHDLIKTTRQKIRDELSSIDKLKIGYQLVSAVADMHGNDPATIPIVHNDICCHQFILVNGIYKLNDFHLAKFQKKHVSSGNTCLSTFSYNWGYILIRSPEEMIRRYPPISLEKSDVYTLGNIMYYTLTSDWLWPNIHSTEAAIYQTARGQRSAFPSTIVESQNPAIQALLQAINWCWNHNPEDRPRAVEIQTYLRQQLAKLLGKSTFNLELDDVRVHGIDKLPPNYSYTDSEYNEMFHRERRRLEQKKYTQVEKRQNQDKTTRTSV